MPSFRSSLAAAASLWCFIAEAAQVPSTSGVPVSSREALQNFSKAHASDPLLQDFAAFVTTFGKQYVGDEWEAGFGAFKESLQLIRSHNAKEKAFKLDLNDFADASPEEFSRTHLGLNASLGAIGGEPAMLATSTAAGTVLPSRVDWRGVMPPVTNQGRCGGCWAFSATAALSAAWKMATGRLPVLSEQQLIDCSVNFGNVGCAGGTMDNAFAYARGAGLCTAESYPFVGSIGFCKAAGCSVAIPRGGVAGYRKVAVSEQALLQAVAQRPVAAGMEAERSGALRLYRSGVVSGMCGTKPNHAVVVVGYGTEGERPYWLIRNSWGPGWGEGGHFKLARGPGPTGTGECGILVMASYPVVSGHLALRLGTADAAAGRSLLGRPPCAEGLRYVSVSARAGIAGEACLPECTTREGCPAPGQCVLRQSTFAGMLFGRQFCAIVCSRSAACPQGAHCARAGDGAGVCLFPTQLLAQNTSEPLAVQIQEVDERAAESHPGRKLSESSVEDLYT